MPATRENPEIFREILNETFTFTITGLKLFFFFILIFLLFRHIW